MDAAPHINGTMTFWPDGEGLWKSSFTRDGFPWAEAYYRDGKGKVQTIVQDPAVCDNPYDLYAYEKQWPVQKRVSKFLQSISVLFGDPKASKGASK